VTVRDLRAADTPHLLEFLKNEFPEEEALLGTRPEGFVKIARRVFRWDTRLLLGLLRIVRRPIFRFFVIEEGDRIVATTLLTFGERAGYVSMVVVDPAHRRRGWARTLLERARTMTRSRGKPYIALDVLAANAPARTLYESLGYRPLRAASYLVNGRPASLLPGPTAVPGLRAFRRSDARPLAEIARREKPPEVEAVLPTTARDLAGSAWVGRMLSSELAAWVLDDGGGPVAWVGASVSVATEAAHLTAPVVDASVGPERARALVETAGAWCAARRAPRVLTMLPAENLRGRAALEGAGFHDAIPVWTLYRPVA
jgi:ribosomal protein S18 acetylase RimI-like enzyme